MNPMVRYLWNLALAYDQLWNARFGGDPDETISSRIGKFERKHGGTIPWRYPVRKFVAWGLDKIDENHCQESIEEDEGKAAIFE